jgi:hypothetical protein
MSKAQPRNVSDVDYATLEGARPMREVIRERKAKARKFKRADYETAYRLRAKEIGLLQTCLCCFPLVKCEAASQHEPWCPSEAMWQSFEAADAAIKASEELDAIGGSYVGES